MKRRHPILRLAPDVFVEWSSIVDAPTRSLSTREVYAIFDEEIKEATAALHEAHNAQHRLILNGHTFVDRPDLTVRSIVEQNCAGMHETCLTYDELVAQAKAQRPDVHHPEVWP